MASSNPPLGFMDLPAEVRLRVYGYLFTSPEPVGTVGRRSQQFYTANLSAQLLCCNKIILTEALPLLFTQNDLVVSHHGDLPKLKRLAPTRTDKAFIHQLCFYGFRLLTKARVREILPLRNLQKITIQSVWYSRFDSIEAITTSKMLQEIADGFATPLSQARPTMSITANVLIKCSCRGVSPTSQDLEH